MAMRYGSFSDSNPRFTPFPSDWKRSSADAARAAADSVPPAPDLGRVMRGEHRMPSLARVQQDAADKFAAERARQRATAGPVDRTVPQPPSLIPAGTKLLGAPEATEEVSRW